MFDHDHRICPGRQGGARHDGNAMAGTHLTLEVLPSPQLTDALQEGRQLCDIGSPNRVTISDGSVKRRIGAVRNNIFP
jgi:hypothetical protein